MQPLEVLSWTGKVGIDCIRVPGPHILAVPALSESGSVLHVFLVPLYFELSLQKCSPVDDFCNLRVEMVSSCFSQL